MLFYSVYASKHNKETLLTLKEHFTLSEFLYHRQFIIMQEDLEAEAHKQLAESRNKR